MIKNVRNKKYYAPQNENAECRCAFPGCTKRGEYRAPKDRGLKEYYWFCLEHVQAYNAEWNYYDGTEDDDREAEEQKAKSRMHFKGFRSKVNYQFGYRLKDDFEFFGDYAGNMPSREEIFFNEQERGFLKIMELKADNISVALIKKQYKKLVKKYHPDLHQDDKQEAEEKFKQLTIAYQALLAKFS